MMSYICLPTRKRGKFMPKEAAKLGCKPKLHFKTLTDGKDVILEDGTIITSDQVMEPSLPCEAFIVNFVPDESYVDSVVSNEKYTPYFAENIDAGTNLSMIYHSIEKLSVLTNSKYIEFMRKFGPNVKHIIDCRELNTEKITRYKAMKLSRQYNTVCSRLYPLSPLNLIDYQKMNAHLVEDVLKDFNVSIAESGLNIELYPAKCAGVYDTDVITHHTYCNPEDQTLLDDIDSKTSEVLQNSELLKDTDINTIVPEVSFNNEPELFFMGTISMKPTGSRSASGIYINLKGNHPNAQEGKCF